MKNLLCLLFCFAAIKANSQTSFAGNWEGKIQVGAEIRVIFHISKTDNGIYTAKMDSPDQGVTGIDISTVTVNADSIVMEVAAIKGKYAGKMTNAGTINGALQQGMMSMAMELKKTEKTEELKRPQTPQPPYAYTSEDVSYTNTDKSITYGATITIPKGKGPFPAILLVTGSGAQNRDEEILGHKPFAVIADYLTNNGYAVLRVDDRGTGKTTGSFSAATTEDFLQDANTSLNYLATRKEVNTKKLGVLGHSEGGLIAEMMGAQNSNLNFAILVGAPGVNTMQLLEEQNAKLMEQAGLSKEMTDAYIALYHNIAVATLNAADANSAKLGITAAVKNWKQNTDPEIVMATTGMINEEAEEKFISGFASAFSSAWMRKFLSYDPQLYLTKIKCKVLAIGGSKDVQVIPSSNLEGIRNGLKKSKSPAYEVKELEGLNHLLQTCKKCTPQEYGQLEETVSPVALQTIKTWLDKEVK